MAVRCHEIPHWHWWCSWRYASGDWDSKHFVRHYLTSSLRYVHQVSSCCDGLQTRESLQMKRKCHTSNLVAKCREPHTSVLDLSTTSSELLIVRRMAKIAGKLSPSSFFPASPLPSASWWTRARRKNSNSLWSSFTCLRREFYGCFLCSMTPREIDLLLNAKPMSEQTFR